jgi:hypothetical protein
LWGRRFLYDQGYKISQYSFQGPFMAESEILAGEVPELVTHISNLYCVQKVGDCRRWAAAAEDRGARLRPGGAHGSTTLPP